MTNIILNTDSYKTSHYLQYPPGTTKVSSYIESRGIDKSGLIPEDAEIVHFGLQMFIQEYLSKPITMGDIDEAHELFEAHGVPFNREGWEYILKEHKGYLPLRISAAPEGAVMKPGNVQVQVVNTDPHLPWLTSYIETALLRAVWYPSTVATLSREAKKVIYENLEATSDDPDGQIPFKLHDFGARGVSSQESAEIGGLAHLVNFMGTDTIASLVAARKFYSADMPAFSIPAAEHSTITAWGRENETKAFKNMVKQFDGEGKLTAVVSDSYDIYKACQFWVDNIDMIKGTVVVRPDSGDPSSVVLKCLKILAQAGTTTNSKGYKLLDPRLRLIQGDGVNPKSIALILDTLKSNQFSGDNIAFGMGGALLQKVDRDTLKYAMKANAIEIGGKWRDVYKEPVTDSGKDSKRGRLKLIRTDGEIGKPYYYTVRKDDEDYEKVMSELKVVYYNGEQVFNVYDLDEIRERAKL